MHEEIGTALRSARRAKKLSLRKVADELGISTSLLSQVENGKTQPSVKTLFGLAAVLDVSLDHLVSGVDPTTSSHSSLQTRANFDARAGIQRGTDNPVIEMQNGVTWQRLASGGRSDIEPLHVTYDPCASSSVEGKMMRHAGIEFAYLLEGELHLRLDFDEHVLHAGDSFCFESSRPHLFFNSGDVAATGLWFIFDDAPSAADTHGVLGTLRSAPLDHNSIGAIAGPAASHWQR